MNRIIDSEKLLRILTCFMLLCFLIFLVFPLVTVFIKMFQDNSGAWVGFENIKKYFESSSLVSSIWNSVHMSLGVTVISVGLAFGMAYGISRTNMRFRNGFQYIAMLPQFVPTMVHGMALIYLFGRQGLITKRLGIDIGLYGETGILIAEVIYTFPQVLMVLVVAMRNADNRLYEAASCLGSNPVRTFFKVTLPGTKYGLISAITIAFTKSFTDFGAPQVVGGNFSVVATDIYKQVLGQQNMSMGAVVGAVLTIPAILAFIIDEISKRKASAETVSARAVKFTPVENKARDRIYLAYSCLIDGLIVMMFMVIGFAAFVKRWPYDFSFTLEHFDFDSVLLNSGMQAIWVSVKMSVLTALFGGILTFLFAYLIEKSKPMPKIRSACRFFAMMPMALPGMVIGLAYVMFFNKPRFAIPFTNLAIPNPFTSLYRTMAIMVISNIVHMISITYVTATTAIKKLDPEYENVADSMAVPFYRVLLRVTVPMSFDAILEIVMYYFVNTMVTISALVFLYTMKNQPMALAILNMDENGDYAAAAAMSLVILAINVCVRTAYEIYRTAAKKRKKYTNLMTALVPFGILVYKQNGGIYHEQLLKERKDRPNDDGFGSFRNLSYINKTEVNVMKKIIAVFLGLCLLLSCTAAFAEATSGKLVVYTALEDDQITEYLTSFYEQYPDIELEINRLSTSTLISKVIAEKENPVADVLWGVAASSLLALCEYDGMIEPYTPAGADRILPSYKDTEENLRWCGIDVFEGAMLVNTQLCEELGLDIPTSYADLLDPQYEGQISMPDPGASGTGLLIVNGWLQMFDDGWEYIRELNKNIAEYTDSGSKPAKMAAAGEYAIGLSFGYRCILLQEENPDETVVVFPTEGTGWDVEANCLLKKDEINPCAYTFLDWAISDSAMEAYKKEMPIIATGTNGEIPAGYTQDPSLNLYADLDLYQAAADRESIISTFTEEILGSR